MPLPFRAVALLLLQSTLSARFGHFARRLCRWTWLQPAIYVVPYTLVGWALILPWSIYEDFVRERSYGLMNQQLAAWLAEQVTGLLVSTVMMMVLATVIFAVIRNFPRTWWLWGVGATAGLLLVAVMLTPVYLMPLFNDYQELPEGPVRDSIVAMAVAEGVPAEHIYVFNQSKQHDRISANVAGFGQTMRIALNDNLLNNSTEAEIKSVMGHEMGHYVMGHIWRTVLVLGLLFGVGFLLAAFLVPRLLQRFGDRWGVHHISDPAVLPVLGLVFAVYGFVITPLNNTLTRVNESDADMFGLEVAREPDGFASIAMKTANYRKIQPGRLEELLMYDHPSPATRVRMAMAWKAEHLQDL